MSLNHRKFGLGAMLSRVYIQRKNCPDIQQNDQPDKKSHPQDAIQELKYMDGKGVMENYSKIMDWILLSKGNPNIKNAASKYEKVISDRCKQNYSLLLTEEDRRNVWLDIRMLCHEDQIELVKKDLKDTSEIHFLEELKKKIENVDNLKFCSMIWKWNPVGKNWERYRVIQTGYLPPLLPDLESVARLRSVDDAGR